MKKIVIMASLLVMAVATQAAQITWNAGTGSGLAANGYVYAFTGTAANRTTVLNLLTANPVSDFNTYYSGLTYVGTKTDSSVPANSHIAMGKGVTAAASSGLFSSTIYATAPNAFVGSSQQGMFYVIFNNADYTKATKFSVSTVQVQTLNATGAKAYSTSWANWGGTGVAGTWTDVVPEPTSMALLALGVAAIGLRRKISK